MGFGHSSRGVQKLCVELAAIIHSNFHVAATVTPEDQDSTLYTEFFDHFDSTLTTKAIELAVNLRALMERCATLANPHPLPQASQITGSIKFLEGFGPCTLRECANKIIHASYFEYQYGHYHTQNQDGTTFSNAVEESTIQLTGRFGKELWRCQIDLLGFALEAHKAAGELGAQFGQ